MRRHPVSLYVLFSIEMWERWGFYLQSAIFALYLNGRIGMSEGQASDTFGTYSGLVYLTPLLGGPLADRVLGYRKSVLGGAVLLCAGYALLSLHAATVPLGHLHGGVDLLLWLAIGTLALGNGMFKPNISTMVGNLYPQNDPRRDSAFSIFYMGVNIGALTSPFVASDMMRHYGWPAAFSCAAIGMMISVVILMTWWRRLEVADGRSSVAAVFDVPLPIEYQNAPEDKKIERDRIIALVTLCAIMTLFWVAFQQSGTTLTFFARDNVLRPASGVWAALLSDEEKFAAINPMFVIILTPLVVWLFRSISTPAKIVSGMLLMACAFLILAVAPANHRVSPAWLIGAYFFATLAELCLSPVGLSLVSRLAPRRMTGLMMGCWFLSSAIGNKLAGTAGRLWDVWPHSRFFFLMAGGSLVAAALVTTRIKSMKEVM